MVALGEAVCVSRGKQPFFRLREAQKPHLISQIRGTSISFAEVEANAHFKTDPSETLRGCRRRSKRGYVGNFVDRSMTKIEIWPEVGDSLAIRVGPRSLGRAKPPQSVRATNARQASGTA